MGLKTTNYTVSTLGITIDNAYAKIINIYLDKNGNAKAYLSIQQSRDDVESLQPLEMKEINFVAVKSGYIYEQAYAAAKTNGFGTWTDDIPPDEATTTTTQP